MTVLVTGGAGYIGSHMVYALLDRGERVVVLDNLSTGVRSLVSNEANFVLGDVGDKSLVHGIVDDHDIDCVIHFAGSAVAPESVVEPLRYYANNTVASQSLIEACVEAGVNRFIFSSTAAIYGPSERDLLAEGLPTFPMNPYGRSKLMTEWILEDVSHARNDFRYVALRYFNVAGTEPLGRTGQSTRNATQLIRRACQVALGRLSHLDIFGTDYPTPDGTAVRDYIHVTDLISAHLLAAKSLRAGAESNVYNCGYGHGVSVREIVAELEHILGRNLPVKDGPRRPGDAARIVADSTKLKNDLNWHPEHDDLGTIIRSAFEWERQLDN